MLKNRILLLMIILSTTILRSQQLDCAFDQQRSFNSLESEASFNQLIYTYLLEHPVLAKTVYTIPTVVHIVHQNGPENISDMVVLDAIAEMNERLHNAGLFYDSTGHDVQIELCLASVDPTGNATNGITRHVSSYTNLNVVGGGTDAQLKNLIRWEPALYLNIWVVKTINMPGFTAYATYPSSAGTAVDGIVLQFNGFVSGLLCHELGHYLGLYHTFEGGCTNFNCQLDGDRICDTPPDGTNNYVCPSNSCATEQADTSGFNPFSSDVFELPNYMDYTNCSVSFTANQVTRMNAVLTQTRSTLLQSNGCGQHPNGAIPIASFTMGNANCYSYPFTNTSINSVGAQWDFNNDGIIDDCGNVVNHAFSTTGSYTVTMYASGYGGIDTVVQQVQVQASPPYQNYPMVNGFSGLVLSPNPSEFNYCAGATVGFHGEAGMVSYLWSTGATTQNISFVPSGTVVISLTAVDQAGLTWTSCYPITITPAPAPQLSVFPQQTIYCVGDTVTIQADFGYYMTTNDWHTDSGLIAGFQDSVLTEVLSTDTYFWVHQQESTGCSTTSDTLFLAVDPSCFAGATELSKALRVFPNPAMDQLFIAHESEEIRAIHLVNTLGQTVMVQEPIAGTSSSVIDVRELLPGMYFLAIQTSNDVLFQRIELVRHK